MKGKYFKYRNIIHMAQLIPFKDVAKALKYHYPNPRICARTMQRYEEIMSEMSKYKENPEKDREWSLVITLSRPFGYYKNKKWEFLDRPGEEYYNVSAAKKGEKMLYAIEFTRWEEAANWKISEQTLKAYKPAEILAHFLWEMTFCGFEQGPIQKECKSIVKTANKAIKKIKKNKKA